MQILTSEDLLRQQLDQVTTRSRRKPPPVTQAKQIGVSYNSKLQQIVNEIKKDINANLLPLLRDLSAQYSTQDSKPSVTKDGWFDLIEGALRLLIARWSSPEFRTIGEQLASDFVRSADQVNRQRVERSFGMNLLVGEPNVDEYLQLATYNNVKLIQSIPEQYLGQVENIVLTNVRAGGRPSAIAEQLVKQYGISQNRAKFIARDQTAKVNSDLNSRRQQNAGFEYFQWSDSNDQRVRDRHREIANKVTAYGKGVYRWDNPPLSSGGTPIIPGQDFGCRCVAIATSNQQVEENQRKGLTKPGVYR